MRSIAPEGPCQAEKRKSPKQSWTVRQSRRDAPRQTLVIRFVLDANAATEQALWAPEQHGDHDHECEGVLVDVGDVSGCQRFGDADEEAREDRALDVPEAA